MRSRSEPAGTYSRMTSKVLVSGGIFREIYLTRFLCESLLLKEISFPMDLIVDCCDIFKFWLSGYDLMAIMLPYLLSNPSYMQAFGPYAIYLPLIHLYSDLLIG